MLKNSDYQIFFDLRDNYPEYCELISEMMKYAFKHKNSFDETTYLDGIFNENDVRFIFEKLNLQLKVLNVIKTNHRLIPQTIVMLSLESKMLVC